MVNSQIAVFNKSGTLLSGPTSLSSLWTLLGGACAVLAIRALYPDVTPAEAADVVLPRASP